MKGKAFFLCVFLIVSLVLPLYQIQEVKAQESSGGFGNPTVPDIAFVNWTKFWKLFNAHSDWDLEYNEGSGWNSIKSDLQVIKNYTVFDGEQWIGVNKSEATTCKITLNFTASYNADYRLTFGVDLDVKNYTHKTDSWNYTISYKNYTVVFDWSDIKALPLDYVGHGVKPIGDESWFWFRIRKDNVAEGKNIIIDPSFGYETIGGASSSIEDRIKGASYPCPEVGTADSITVGLYSWDSGEQVKCAIYKKSDDSLVGVTEERTTGGIDGFHTFIFSEPKPSLIATDYVLCAWGNETEDDLMIYLTVLSWYRYSKTQTYNSYPNPFDGTTGNSSIGQYSIFCNYTVEEEGEAYIADLTQSLTTTWSVVTEWDAILDLTQSLTTSWTVLTQTTFNIIASLSNTFSWLVDIVHTVGGIAYIADLSQAISTTWTILTQWNAITNLSQSLTTTWTVLIQSSFNIVTSLSNTFTWTVEIYHWVFTGIAYTVDLSLAILSSWIVDVVHTPWIAGGPPSTFGTLAFIVALIALALVVTLVAKKRS